MIGTLYLGILTQSVVFTVFTVERESGLEFNSAVVRSRSASNWLHSNELLNVALWGNRSVVSLIPIPNRPASGLLEIHDYRQKLVNEEYNLVWERTELVPYGSVGSLWNSKKMGTRNLLFSGDGWANWFEKNPTTESYKLMMAKPGANQPNMLKQFANSLPSRVVLCDNSNRLVFDIGHKVQVVSLQAGRLVKVVSKSKKRADFAVDASLQNWISWSPRGLISKVKGRTMASIPAEDYGSTVCKWGDGAVMEVKSLRQLGKGVNPDGTPTEAVVSQLIYWRANGKFAVLDTLSDTPGNLDIDNFNLPTSIPAGCPLVYSVWSNRVRAVDPVTHKVRLLFTSMDPILKLGVALK